MRPVEKLFREYEAFHKDPRNKITHYFGITAIVLALVTALDVVPLPGPSIGEWGPPTLAFPVVAATALFYTYLDIALGVGSLFVLLALTFAGKSCGGWQGALGLFVAGWVLQFVGHYFEGKKPAFFRNGVHLLVGPLWILSHLYEKLGLRAKPAAPAAP